MKFTQYLDYIVDSFRHPEGIELNGNYIPPKATAKERTVALLRLAGTALMIVSLALAIWEMTVNGFYLDDLRRNWTILKNFGLALAFAIGLCMADAWLRINVSPEKEPKEE